MQSREEFIAEIKEDAKTEAARQGLLDLTVRPGDIRFNDILMNIPPEKISIIQTEYENCNFMLREAIPSTVKSGRKKIIVHIPLVFDLGTTGSNYSDIARLLIQIRKCPIITVENEKLRTEIYGPGSDESISMSFIVESISGSIDGEFPTLLRCDLQMSWFNHLPYTPSVLYQGSSDGTEPMISKFPTSLFTKFYTHGTSKDGQLINDPTFTDLLLENSLDIFYKEYRVFNESVSISNDPAKPSNLNKRVKVRNQKAGDLLKADGWVPAAERLGFKDIDGVYYRWRKFSIPSTALAENGPLILESLSFGLHTNVAYIPLQGYSVPTAQFMGGSVAQVNGIVFAGAECDEENNPIATCPKLGALQKILDRHSENRLLFEKYAGEDCLLLRHSLTKLLKYKPYTENRIKTGSNGQSSSFRDSFFYDHESISDKVFEFDYDDMLPVVVTNRVSSTVEGHPFASRFQFQTKETRLRNDNDSIRIAGDTANDGAGLARNSIKEAWLGVAKELEKTYKISKVESQEGSFFKINSDRKDPDREEAMSLAEAMTNMLHIDSSFSNLDAISKSKFFTYYKSELRSIAHASRIKNRRDWRNDNFLNTQKVSEIVASILKKAADENYTGWAKRYAQNATAVQQLGTIPGSDTYPDLMIPAEETSPTFFFHDFEDETFHKANAMKGMLALADKVDENIINRFISKESHKDIGEDIAPSSGGVSVAFSLATGGDRQQKHAIAHNPASADHRNLLAMRAMNTASPMTCSLKQAFPTFKIYLRQENLFFPRELSIADKSRQEQQSNLADFRDFSEYFDVSNVVDVRLVKDQDNPADLLIIRVIATDRDKVNKIKQNIEYDTQEHKYTHELVKDILTDTKKKDGSLTSAEERLKKYGLTEGVRIQARLGYETNPNDLPVEFNGKIVSVRGKDIIEVICLGNGEELIKEIKAASSKDEYSFNSNTPDLIAEILEDSPEVVSFGNLNYKSDTGFEISLLPEFMGGRTVLDNIFAPSLFQDYTMAAASVNAISNTTLLAVTGQAAVAVGVKLGLIAAGAVSLGAILAVGVAAAGVYEGYKYGSRWLFGSPFTVYNNTIWDVLQELTLRHPGAICSVVPYDNRSTIFFGEPNEHYFYRGPTPLEANLLPTNGIRNRTTREIYDYTVLGLDDDLGETQSQAGALERLEKKKQVLSKVRTNAKPTVESTVLSLVKPFRNYHLVASEHDIIANTIEVTSRDVGNAIQIAYPKDSDDGNFDGSVGYTDYELSNEIEADDDLYNEHIKKKVLTFHNAHKDAVEDLPERYAKSVLVKELEKIYRGKLTIMGRPNIKPHDVVIIRDTVNDIMGPIGVAKVIQIMSPHQGWITEIVPKMMVFPDNASGVFQLSLVTKGAAYWLSDEYQRFYTNLRRFMPTESGFSNLGTNLFDLGRLIGGSDTIDYENIGFEDKESVDIMNTGTASKSLTQGASVVAAGATSIGLQTAALGLDIPQRLAGATVNSAIASKDAAAAVFARGVTSTARATSAVTAGLQAGTAASRAVLTLGSAFTGPLVHLGLSAFVDAVVSWTKYRQPIMFFPLYREGEAWYAAMNGFKDNTIIQHFSNEYGKVKNKFEFYGLYIDRVMNDMFRK